MSDQAEQLEITTEKGVLNEVVQLEAITEEEEREIPTMEFINPKYSSDDATVFQNPYREFLEDSYQFESTEETGNFTTLTFTNSCIDSTNVHSVSWTEELKNINFSYQVESTRSLQEGLNKIVLIQEKSEMTKTVKPDLLQIKTVADFTIKSSFCDAGSLKETIRQNCQECDLTFDDSFIKCGGIKATCRIVVSSQSNSSGRGIIKNLYENLKKNLKKNVTYYFYKESNKKQTDPATVLTSGVNQHNLVQQEQPQEGKNIRSKVETQRSPRNKRFCRLIDKNESKHKNTTGSKQKEMSDFLLQKQLQNKDLHRDDKSKKRKSSVAEKQVRHNHSEQDYKDVTRIKSPTHAINVKHSHPVKNEMKEERNKSRKTVHTVKPVERKVSRQVSKNQVLQSERSKRLIEQFRFEISNKTQRVLHKHNEKIRNYQSSLKICRASSNKRKCSDETYDEILLLDKIEEANKQRATFLERIENIEGKVQTSHPCPQEVNLILQAVGVECERLTAALPIYARRDDIIKKVKENQVSIILGETGSGKSTQMAQYICEAGLAGHGQIVCTQPRKVAAITLAERVAKETAGKIGNIVGFRTGLREHLSAKTKIIFSTDHCHLNECLTDRDFSRYTCIIVDEAHERNIYTDLLLGLIKDCLPRRLDLKVVITSATIDPEIFISYFNCSSELKISGQAFPVDTEYSEVENSEEFEKYEDKAIQKAAEVHRQEEPGDILVFLTSSVEIMRCCEEFQKLMRGRTDFQCFPLHGQLPPDEQRKVFETLPPQVRKIVFATNCAETSITIDGIKYVIDTGVAKEVRYDSKRNISMLGTFVISKSSADQRKGRAGRTASGKCYRLYSEAAYRQMETSTKPEILKVPLGQSLLKLAALGIDAKRYDFVESPNPEAIDAALKTLKNLNAINADGVITDVGRWISKLPFNPHEGFLVYRGLQRTLLYDSLVLASLISQGSSLFYKSLAESEAQDSARTKSKFGSIYGDIFTSLEVFKAIVKVPGNQQSKWCKERGINYKVVNYAKQCIKEATDVLSKEFNVTVTHIFSSADSTISELRKIICETYINSVCHYLGHVRAGYFAVEAERQVHFHPSSILHSDNSQPEWIVYTEFTKTSRDFVKGITVVEEDWVREAFNEGKLHTDIIKAKSVKIESVFRVVAGQDLFRHLVGLKYSRLKIWEEALTKAGMKTVVVEADRDLGVFEIFSTSPMDPVIADQIWADKKLVTEKLKSEEAEIVIMKKLRLEVCGIRVVLGQGNCVKHILMPDESNKILIVKSSSRSSEEVIKQKFQKYGEIKNIICFKKERPWGFITYSSISEAQAAVLDTCNDDANVAVLKIDTRCKKIPNSYEAKLSWCRRPIKSPGIAFIKCDPYLRNVLLDSHIELNGRKCFLELSRRGQDIVCYKTGTSDEIQIKQKIMDMIHFDESLEGSIGVELVRESGEDPLLENVNQITKYLTDSFKSVLGKSKFSIHLMPVRLNSINHVAFIHFENPILGFNACQSLRGSLHVRSEPILISPQLKTSLYVPRNIVKICEDHFEKLIRELEEYKDTRVNIRPLKHGGDFALEIKSEDAVSMIKIREILLKELEGEVIDRKTNDNVQTLLKQRGRDFLCSIESKCNVLIVVNYRKEQIRVYGSSAQVAKNEINDYLELLAEARKEEIRLRGHGKPPGLMKELVKAFGNLEGEFMERFGLSDVTINFRQQKLIITGPTDCISRTLADISALEDSLNQRMISRSQQWNSECVVCMCPFENKAEIYRLELCGHSYCLSCLKQQIDVSMQEKQFPVICAEESCGMQLAWKDFRFFIRNEWTSEEILMEKSLGAFVASNPDKYRFCLTPDCPVLYKVTSDEEGCEFCCPSCSFTMCTSCHAPFHFGLTCKMLTNEREMLISWVKESSQNRKCCPKCKAIVEKNGGCRKMFCLFCRTIFCWLCLETFFNNDACYAHLVKAHNGFFDNEHN